MKKRLQLIAFIYLKPPSPFLICMRLAVYCMVLTILLGLSPSFGFAQGSPEVEPDINQLMQGKAYIYKFYPENAGGKGYKLVYMVAASLSAYWNFKTDFENDFLLSNKLIVQHRLVEHKDNVVITETIYETKPDVVFRWRTTISSENHRLDFELLNPKECGQKFHYGHIQLEELGEYTKVTQIAYFDFFGVTLWMGYPLYGGMQYYLSYTASWEQETIVRLMNKYQ